MYRKPHKSRATEMSDPRDRAAKMADAVSYLCRVAAEEGFDAVLLDLVKARRKLEDIASSENPPIKNLTS